MYTIAHTPRLNTGIANGKIIFYKGINPNFRNEIKLKPLILNDIDAIQAQMINILKTPIGSEYFMPDFGSNIYYRLGDPINMETSFLLEQDTVEALSKWMGGHIEVYLNSSYVTPIYEEDAYDIAVAYSPIFTKADAGTLNFKVFR